MDAQVIYRPVEGNLSGYYYFPVIPCAGRLELIGLRDEGLVDGFGMKEDRGI